MDIPGSLQLTTQILPGGDRSVSLIGVNNMLGEALVSVENVPLISGV